MKLKITGKMRVVAPLQWKTGAYWRLRSNNVKRSCAALRVGYIKCGKDCRTKTKGHCDKMQERFKRLVNKEMYALIQEMLEAAWTQDVTLIVKKVTLQSRKALQYRESRTWHSCRATCRRDTNIKKQIDIAENRKETGQINPDMTLQLQEADFCHHWNDFVCLQWAGWHAFEHWK